MLWCFDSVMFACSVNVNIVCIFMPLLIFSYLPIVNNENAYKIFQGRFNKYQVNSQTIAKDFYSVS